MGGNPAVQRIDHIHVGHVRRHAHDREAESVGLRADLCGEFAEIRTEFEPNAADTDAVAVDEKLRETAGIVAERIGGCEEELAAAEPSMNVRYFDDVDARNTASQARASGDHGRLFHRGQLENLGHRWQVMRGRRSH